MDRDLLVTQQIRALAPSRVRLSRPEKGVPEIVTENVRALAFLRVPAAGEPASVRIDGQDLPHSLPETMWYTRAPDGRWKGSRETPAGKNPGVYGPFKDAFFGRRVTFVFGTGGTEEEDAWAFAKARYDAEQFAYRGNGAVRVIPDTERDPGEEGNVVLYGNRDTNRAWAVLQPSCPIDVRRGSVRVGERRVEGEDLVCLFCCPTTTGNGAAVVAPTGAAGARLAETVPYFTSGIAYPDWCVLRADLPEVGIAGVRAAGFFDAEWSLGDDAAWR